MQGRTWEGVGETPQDSQHWLIKAMGIAERSCPESRCLQEEVRTSKTDRVSGILEELTDWLAQSCVSNL